MSYYFGMKQSYLFGIIVVLILLATGLGWTLLSLNKPAQTTEPSTTEATVPIVTDTESATTAATDKRKPPRFIPGTTTETEPVSADTEAILDLTPGYLITVHIEPEQNPTVEWQNWGTLSTLVNLANEYDMKLSLHFSASMASLVSQNREFIDTVWSWERDGHEIGVHHHDPSHAAWDGYTDDASLIGSRGYLGTITEMMDLVSALSADKTILTGSGTSNPDEWPEGVIYGSRGGSPPSYKQMVMTAETDVMGNTTVTFLPKAPFNVSMISAANSATYDRIKDVLNDVNPDEYLGLTITDKTLDDQGLADLERVFQLYVDNNIQTQTIEVLLHR